VDDQLQMIALKMLWISLLLFLLPANDVGRRNVLSRFCHFVSLCNVKKVQLKMKTNETKIK